MIFGKLPIYLSIGLGVALGVQSWRLANEKADHAETRRDYALRVASAEKDRADEEARRRKAENDLSIKQAEIDRQAEAFRQDLDRIRRDAAVAGSRLRDSAATAALAAGAQCADSTATAISETAGRAARMLADVLAEIDTRSGILAEAADRSRQAGLSCQQAYENARTAVQ